MTDLSYLPDYQRAAVVFIDMQIADLDAQRKRLEEARTFLSGFSPLPQIGRIDEIITSANGDLHAVEVKTVKTAVHVPKRDYSQLLQDMTDFLKEHGLIKRERLAEAMGCDSSQIRYVITRNRSLFVVEGTRTSAKWRLRLPDEPIQEVKPFISGRDSDAVDVVVEDLRA